MKRLVKGLTVSRSWGCEDILLSNTYNGFTAVAFQFSRIGNDSGAAKLLQDLDRDETLRKLIDVLPVEFDPECLLAEKWFYVILGFPSPLIRNGSPTNYMFCCKSYRRSCSVQFYLV